MAEAKEYNQHNVTVSARRSAGFYSTLAATKLRTLDTVELIAADTALANAVQVAETLKSRKEAVVTDITTSYGYGPRGGNFRAARINITLQRTPQYVARVKEMEEAKKKSEE